MNLNNTLHLLLIEDNPADAEFIQILLKDASVKHELYITNTLFEGINKTEEREIDMALLDLSLPDTHGFKTLTTFLEKCPNVPVIVMTGTNNELIGNQAIKAGAMDYLVKGQFDGKLLGRAIRYSTHRIKNKLQMEATARELAISEKRFVEAQEMAHFGNWEMDIVSSQMLWAEEIFRIFGFTPNSISPTLSDYIQYTHPEDKPAVQAFFDQASKDGKLHHLSHRIIVNGRSIKHVQLQGKMNFDEIRQKLLLVGAIQDITQQKLTEQLIIEKNISNKAGIIKDKALADISFHIRTPLSSVINLLYLMEKSGISGEQEELMDGLKTSVDDLSMMVNNLLNFSVLISDKIAAEKEVFVIHDFLESTKRILKMRTESANIHLDFSTISELPKKIISDTKKITQVIYNLMDYLIAETDVEQTLRIAASMDNIDEGSAHLIFKMSSEQLLLNQEQITDLYEAEKLLEIHHPEEDDNKLLIGMAIVTKLVQILKGDFKIHSDNNSGTSFKIKIPVEIAKQRILQHGGKPTAPLRILLVEDHFLNQIATKKVLTSWSDQVSVEIAENGRIGVDLHQEKDFDLILMDIQMPVMNGIDAAEAIRKSSSVPIVALTANASKMEEDKCLSIGMNDYVSKPFKPEVLYGKIMEVLNIE